jgi:hypothetical protein
MPDMIAPLFESGIAPRMLVLAGEDPKKLALPGAWLGSAASVLLMAFIVLTFSPLIRGLEDRPALPAGPARSLAWLSATVSVASMVILGAAIGLTVKTFTGLALFGFLPWAAWGAWAGIAAGVLGLITVWAVFHVRRRKGLAGSRVAGFSLTGIAAVAYAVFLYWWGLAPF